MTSLHARVCFLCEYLEMSGDTHQHDYKSVRFYFDRSVTTNDLENADIAQKSKGIISDRTIVANHPFVDNLEDELAQIEKEKLERNEIFDLDRDDDDDE